MSSDLLTFEESEMKIHFSLSDDQKTFRARKATAKSPTLRLQGCFIHIFLI